VAGGFATEAMGSVGTVRYGSKDYRSVMTGFPRTRQTPAMTDALARRRRTPTQERARDTVDAICAAAATIIEDGGITSLTTNAVAMRAGVSITSVYAYFPDKWAIVHELFERFEQLRAEALVGIFADFATADDWAPIIDETWRRMARFRIDVRGGVALRQALHGNPRLAALDFEGSVRTAQRFADSMRERRPDLAPVDAYRASWTVTLAAGALIDDAVRDGTVSAERLGEGLRMIKTHLASYLDAPLPANGGDRAGP
jgi:AcrR family transcriptional regulator